MGRLDWKKGRFRVDYETNEIHGALGGHQHTHGIELDYWRYREAGTQDGSVSHDIYDEGWGTGRAWLAPVNLPVLHVIALEGRQEDRPEGGYYSDDAHVTAAYDQLTRCGLTRLDIVHQNYLKDRIGYNDKIFRVLSIKILGQIQRRDIIVSIDAAQAKPDELVNDPQFAAWATRGSNPLGG